MNLESKFPLTFQFFAGYFSMAEFDGLSDIDVVQQFIADNSNNTIQDTKKELEQITYDSQVIESIVQYANRYFETSEKAWEWFLQIRNSLKNRA